MRFFIVLACLFLFGSMHSFAQKTVCLGVNCDIGSSSSSHGASGDFLLYQSEMTANFLENQAMGFSAQAGYLNKERQECYKQCRKSYNSRRRDCRVVFDNLMGGSLEGLATCMEHAESKLRQCLSPYQAGRCG